MGYSEKEVMRAYVKRNRHRSRGRSYQTLGKHTKNVIEWDRKRNGLKAPQSVTFSPLHNKKNQVRTSRRKRKGQGRTSGSTEKKLKNTVRKNSARRTSGSTEKKLKNTVRKNSARRSNKRSSKGTATSKRSNKRATERTSKSKKPYISSGGKKASTHGMTANGRRFMRQRSINRKKKGISANSAGGRQNDAFIARKSGIATSILPRGQSYKLAGNYQNLSYKTTR